MIWPFVSKVLAARCSNVSALSQSFGEILFYSYSESHKVIQICFYFVCFLDKLKGFMFRFLTGWLIVCSNSRFPFFLFFKKVYIFFNNLSCIVWFLSRQTLPFRLTFCKQIFYCSTIIWAALSLPSWTYRRPQSSFITLMLIESGTVLL